MSTVLVVDDIDVVRFTLRKFLERGGHIVIECASVEEAEQVLRQSTPDLVVTDLWMPGGDGVALIARLRETHANLPIIAITGGAPRLPRETSIEQAQMAGARHALMKPVGMQALLSCVDEGLREAESSGQGRRAAMGARRASSLRS